MFVQTPMVPSSKAKHYAMVQKDTTSGVTYVLKFYSYILNRASIFKWNWTSIQYYSMLHLNVYCHEEEPAGVNCTVYNSGHLSL